MKAGRYESAPAIFAPAGRVASLGRGLRRGRQPQRRGRDVREGRRTSARAARRLSRRRDFPRHAAKAYVKCEQWQSKAAECLEEVVHARSLRAWAATIAQGRRPQQARDDGRQLYKRAELPTAPRRSTSGRDASSRGRDRPRSSARPKRGGRRAVPEGEERAACGRGAAPLGARRGRGSLSSPSTTAIAATKRSSRPSTSIEAGDLLWPRGTCTACWSSTSRRPSSTSASATTRHRRPRCSPVLRGTGRAPPRLSSGRVLHRGGRVLRACSGDAEREADDAR